MKPDGIVTSHNMAEMYGVFKNSCMTIINILHLISLCTQFSILLYMTPEHVKASGTDHDKL